MSRFLATFDPASPGSADCAGEDRVGPATAQGCSSQDLEIHFTGAPWWDRDKGPATDAPGIRQDICAAYRSHGENMFASAGGGFAIAILDRSAGRLLLGIDPMGIGSLSYAQSPGGTVVFGTSPRTVARHPAIAAPLSPQALFDYLHFHMVPSPGSAYEGVSKLRAGHMLTIDGAGSRLHRYFRPRFATALDEPFPILKDQLLAALEAGVRRALPGCTRPGAFLSGGLDSSTVVGMLAKVANGSAHTFSVGFGATGYDELDYARLVNRHFGATGTEFTVTPEHITAAIPEIAGFYDEPFGNSSAVPALLCARLARQHGITRLLAGDGGDELFGGNPHYPRQWIFELYRRLPDTVRRTATEDWLLRVLPPRSPWPLNKLRSYIEQARIPLPRRIYSWDFMFRTSIQSTFTADFLGMIRQGHIDELMTAVYSECDGQDVIDRLLYYDWQFVLADNDLRKVSGTCEMAGIEVGFPMLDRDIVEFSLRIPASQKSTGSSLRPFYKDAVRGFLPAEVISKKKHGFGLPFGLWLKDSRPLQDLVFDSLNGLKERHILRHTFLNDIVQQHRAGDASFLGYAIWDLVMLEQWLTSHGERL